MSEISKLPGHFDKFNWQKLYSGDHFENMLSHIAEFFPPEPSSLSFGE